MTASYIAVAVAASFFCVSCACALREPLTCEVRAHTDAGSVCGLFRRADDRIVYASFRGVPYAKQPVGELRFKELEPPEPWEGDYDATVEGPVCYQTDVLYGTLTQPQGMSEACIHANIHVPYQGLLIANQRLARDLQSPYQVGASGRDDDKAAKGLPILVFVHGGGFMCGSGDADLHGPEYLVSKKVIVITFNYRLNVFGFLSLNSLSVPGNNGLRDIVTLLQWVQRNAQAFGGNPDEVTLAGQSAGASAVHLLTLSKAAEGLFKRAILMSGTAISNYITTSPTFSQYISNMFLTMLGINSTDPEDIHRKLINMPIEKINKANSVLLDQFGLTTFLPTVESSFPGVTTILDEDPEILIAKGRGRDIPLIIGFTNAECEFMRPRLEHIDIVSQIKENPFITVPLKIIYKTPQDNLPELAKRIEHKYFNDTINLDSFVKFCSESYFQYPALELAEKRAEMGGAPVYLYQLSYDGENSVIKEALGLKYTGAAHIEDLTYIFKVNYVLGTRQSFPPRNRDDSMKDLMTTLVTNFMECSKPVCRESKPTWTPVPSDVLQLEDIKLPKLHPVTELTDHQRDFKEFFDSLQNKLNNKKTVT